MAIFTWTPEWALTQDKKPRILKAQFGDGYSQRTQDGINNNPDTVTLRFASRTDTETAAIMAFLDGQAGWQAFTWTTPDGMTSRWTCDQYKRTHVRANLNDVDATFVQVFEP